jgi:8-oxo-dGTP diphosphatase
MNFHGVKVALLVGDKLIMHLRDNKPGLFNANMWDFPGGGRENDETPQACAIREVYEEFRIVLTPESFLYERTYPAQKDATQIAYFMVAQVSEKDIQDIVLTEGQQWQLFDQESFFEKDDVIEALKVRFRDYLNSIH